MLLKIFWHKFPLRACRLHFGSVFVFFSPYCVSYIVSALPCDYSYHVADCASAQRYFQCRSGHVISLSDWCNEKYDCPDGSDEECVPSLICAFDTCHRCSDTGACVRGELVCDGRFDCPNGEDESWAECASGSDTHWFNVRTRAAAPKPPATPLTPVLRSGNRAVS